MSVNAKERRKMFREGLKQSQEESYNRRGDSGKYKSIFNPKISKESFWKCAEGVEQLINIIPFVAGANHPLIKEERPAHELDLFVHEKVGANEDNYVCMNRSFQGSKKCPICEEQAHLRKMGASKEELKALEPTRRVIYNIEDTKGAPGVVKIWIVSQYLFGLNLVELANRKKGGKIYFADPDDGKLISFKRTGMGAMNTKYIPMSFEDRDIPISEEILNKSYCLDEIVHFPTYEEVSIAFMGRAEGDGKELSPEAEIPHGKDDDNSEDNHLENSPPEIDEDDVQDQEPVCEFDHTFGKDFDEYEECSRECAVFSHCEKKYKELQEDKERRRLEREKEKTEIEKGKSSESSSVSSRRNRVRS